MGKKKGLAAIFSKPSKPSGSPPWPWPSCATSPQTASFRRDDRPRATARQSGSGPNKAAAPGDDMYRTVNSVYFDPTAAADSFSVIDEEEEGFGDALDDAVSYSAATASEEWSSEAVIRRLGRGACTDRLFFDPPPVSNSTLAASREPPPQADPAMTPDSDEEPPPPLVERSVAVALDSDDPLADFRASMEEMVAAHGLRDWAALQDMLLCYLRINAKRNHALILGAFVDLLVGLASSSSSSSAAATTTTTATTTTATEETSSSSWSTSSVAGDGATCSSTAATTGEEEPERCGGGSGTGASSCSASSDQEDDLALHIIRLSSS
jgi:uncharacterized protein (TIGR01568 family)